MTQKEIAEDIQRAVETLRKGGLILYPTDTIWGIGMQESDSGIANPHNWKGLNQLGFALMEVRDELMIE